MAVQTTSTISQEVGIWYEKVFLARAEVELVHKEGAQMRSRSGNEGTTVRFTRYSPLALATTPLTEGSNPAESNLTAVNVDATLAEYGNSVKVSRLLSTTGIDKRDKEKIEVVGQNMGETLDALARDALFAGATAQGSGAAVLSPTDLRKSVRTLKSNKALRYAGKFGWMGKIQPETEFDLTGSSTWENAKIHSSVEDLYRGEIGGLYGIRLLVTNQGKVVTTTYSNFVHGREAFGVFDNSDDKPKLYPVSGPDSANPANRFSFLSWAGQYVVKVLNGNWVIDIKTSASA